MTTNENGAFPTPEMFEIERLRKELATAEGAIKHRSELATQLQTLVAKVSSERDVLLVQKANLLVQQAVLKSELESAQACHFKKEERERLLLANDILQKSVKSLELERDRLLVEKDNLFKSLGATRAEYEQRFATQAKDIEEKRAECGRYKTTVVLLDKEAEELKKASASVEERLAKSELREALELERSSALRSLGMHTARDLHVLLAAASVAESLTSATRIYAADVADKHPDSEDARRVVVYLDAILDALQGAL